MISDIGTGIRGIKYRSQWCHVSVSWCGYRCHWHHVSVSLISGIGIIAIRYLHHWYQVSVSLISGIGINDIRYRYIWYQVSVSCLPGTSIIVIGYRYRIGDSMNLYHWYQVSASMRSYIGISDIMCHGLRLVSKRYRRSTTVVHHWYLIVNHYRSTIHMPTIFAEISAVRLLCWANCPWSHNYLKQIKQKNGPSPHKLATQLGYILAGVRCARRDHCDITRCAVFSKTAKANIN